MLQNKTLQRKNEKKTTKAILFLPPTQRKQQQQQKCGGRSKEEAAAQIQANVFFLFLPNVIAFKNLFSSGKNW